MVVVILRRGMNAVGRFTELAKVRPAKKIPDIDITPIVEPRVYRYDYVESDLWLGQ